MNDPLHAYRLREIQEYQAIAQIVITRRINRQMREVCRAILGNVARIQKEPITCKSGFCE